MKLINKYEATGILLSIAVMTLALAVVRSETSILSSETTNMQDQSAVAVVATEDDGGNVLRETLKDSMTNDGELVKLIIDDIRIGTGDVVQQGDTVVTHYIGRTRDGVEFDSSYARGQTFEFTVGGGKVIEGWEKGLVGMKVGGQRVLVIPAEMAYGNRQVGPIPPNTPLVFAVELLEIK